MEEETQKEVKLSNLIELILSGLQGPMKDWAITEPETSLILGNVRRMLHEVYQAGRAQAIDDAVGCVPSEETMKAALDSGSDAGAGYTIGHNACREQTLQALSALQK